MWNSSLAWKGPLPNFKNKLMLLFIALYSSNWSVNSSSILPKLLWNNLTYPLLQFYQSLCSNWIIYSSSYHEENRWLPHPQKLQSDLVFGGLFCNFLTLYISKLELRRIYFKITFSWFGTSEEKSVYLWLKCVILSSVLHTLYFSKWQKIWCLIHHGLL